MLTVDFVIDQQVFDRTVKDQGAGQQKVMFKEIQIFDTECFDFVNHSTWLFFIDAEFHRITNKLLELEVGLRVEAALMQ